MTDDRERTPGWMSEQPLRELRQECMRRDRGRSMQRLVREVVQPRCPGPVASEEDRDQPSEPGVVAHISGREVEIGGDGLPPLQWAGPVLTQQCPLVGELPRMTLGKSHPDGWR